MKLESSLSSEEFNTQFPPRIIEENSSLNEGVSNTAVQNNARNSSAGSFNQSKA